MSLKNSSIFSLVLTAIVTLITACGSNNSPSAPAANNQPANTPTFTLTVASSSTPTNSPTKTPTTTPGNTATPTPTTTPTNSPTATPYSTISAVTFAPSPAVYANQSTDYTVQFVTGTYGTLSTTDSIVVTFPAGFNISGENFTLDNMNGGMNVTISGQTLTLTRNGTGTTQSGFIYMDMPQIVSPPAGVYTVLVHTSEETTDEASNPITIQNAPTNTPTTTPTNSPTVTPTSTPTNSPTATPYSTISAVTFAASPVVYANQSTDYTVQFTTGTYGTLSTTDSIVVTFPAGFNISGENFTLDNMNGGMNVTISGQTLTLTRNGTGTTQSGFIYMDMPQIVSPPAGVYTVLVHTSEETTDEASNPITIQNAPTNSPTSTPTDTPTLTSTPTATTCTVVGLGHTPTPAAATAGYYYAQQLFQTATTLYSLSAYAQNTNSISGPASFYLGLYDASTGNLLASGSFTSAYSTSLQYYTVNVAPVTLPSDGFNIVLWLPGTDPAGQELGMRNTSSSVYDYGTYGGSSLPANYSSFTSLSGGFSLSPGEYGLTFLTCP